MIALQGADGIEILKRLQKTFNFGDGEDAIMELKRAVYGLKQASASFYTAMDLHLKSKGFVPTLGDPCLYRRVTSNGSVIIACLTSTIYYTVLQILLRQMHFLLSFGNGLKFQRAKALLLISFSAWLSSKISPLGSFI